MTPALVAEVETMLFISQVDNEVKLNKKKKKKGKLIVQLHS